MTIRLRGHHLLCLLGYRGKGYSESFCVNMTEIYERLRLHPETEIVIVEGPDDICRAFPSDQISHCMNDSVFRKEILQKQGTCRRFVCLIGWRRFCGQASVNL